MQQDLVALVERRSRCGDERIDLGGLGEQWRDALGVLALLRRLGSSAVVIALRIGGIAGSDVHWGLVLGVCACLVLGLWLRWTPGGFAVRVVGGNPRAAQTRAMAPGDSALTRKAVSRSASALSTAV